MGYNLVINRVYWGYNPLTNHFLTSWDIQVSTVSAAGVKFRDVQNESMEWGSRCRIVSTAFNWVVATQIFLFLSLCGGNGPIWNLEKYLKPPRSNIKTLKFHRPRVWGNDPIWRAYFSDGWFNHQLVNLFSSFFCGFWTQKSCTKWVFFGEYPTLYGLGIVSHSANGQTLNFLGLHI